MRDVSVLEQSCHVDYDDAVDLGDPWILFEVAPLRQ